MPENRPTAIVYIDGLNLYRQRLKGKNHLKWLDPFLLAQQLYPDIEILEVHYFSALIRTTNSNSEPALRQQKYLKAIEQYSNSVTIHLGKMRQDVRRYPSHPITIKADGSVETLKVVKLEEKGTDVAIAAHLIADVAQARADTYVLISNDSDFEPLIALAHNRFHANSLRIDSRTLSEEILTNSQFTSLEGKPRTWI